MTIKIKQVIFNKRKQILKIASEHGATHVRVFGSICTQR